MGDRDRLAAALEEFWEMIHQGKKVDPQAFIQAHAGLEKELNPCLEAVLDLEEAFPNPPHTPLQPPDRVGDFQIIREISRGNMGTVYEAEQISIKRRVALKLIPPGFTGKKRIMDRFTQEAQAAGLQSHTNIVAIYGMGQHGDFTYYSMEYLPGPTLKEILLKLQTAESLPHQGSRLPFPSGWQPGRFRKTGREELKDTFFTQVAVIFAGVADALGATGEKGIIHRDIKPANLIFDDGGNLKIVDFGLARLKANATMTIPGAVLGTPSYMSPEQVRGRSGDIDQRADIYSLGATLYETLTLQVPFAGESLEEVLSHILSRDIAPVQTINHHVPLDLATIVEKALEKTPGQRYGSGREMAKDLLRFAMGKMIQARPIGPFRKFIRKIKRYRVHCTIAAILLGLILCVVLLTLQIQQTAEQEQRTEYERLLRAGQLAMGRSSTRILQAEDRAREQPDLTARDFFDRAIALDPDKPKAYWLRVFTPGQEISLQLKDVDAALAHGLPQKTYHLLRSFIFSRPGPQQKQYLAYTEWAQANTLSGKTEIDLYAESRILHSFHWRARARQLLNQAIEQSPPSGTVAYLARCFRSEICLAEGDLAGSMRDLMVIRSYGDRRPKSTVFLASLWKQLGNPAAAEALFKEALAGVKSSGNLAAWESLYWGCRKSGERAWMEQTALAGTRRHPQSLHLLYGLHLTGRYQEAALLLAGLVEREPDNHHAQVLYGMTLHGAGESTQATEVFAKALALEPNCRFACYNRALGLEANLDLPTSTRWYSNYQDMAPDSSLGILGLLRTCRKQAGKDLRFGKLAQCLQDRFGSNEQTHRPKMICQYFHYQRREGKPDWTRTSWQIQSPLDHGTFLPLHTALAQWDRLTPTTASRDLEQKLLLFIGSQGDGGEGSLTMEWTGVDWQRHQSGLSPGPRRSHAMVYDRHRNRTVLFSGWNGEQYLHDTWEWDGKDWHQKTPAHQPHARDHHAMAYDIDRRRTVLFGGWTWPNQVLYSDTWEWDGRDWTPIPTPKSPPGRDGHALAYDPVRKQMVLFGGGRAIRNKPPMGDTWTFDGIQGKWLQAKSKRNPSARFNHSLLWDKGQQALILLGGHNKTGVACNDRWKWNGTQWLEDKKVDKSGH